MIVYRSQKPPERRSKSLFIDTVNEIARYLIKSDLKSADMGTFNPRTELNEGFATGRE